MEPRNYIDPFQYDVLLSDVTHSDLISEIAERLEVEYLKEATSPSSSVVRGVLYGSNYRPMVNLVISSKRHNKQVNVIFLVDTGSPNLYISEQAMHALGFTDNIPKTFEVYVGDNLYEAFMSPMTHYHDINLIGASFLSAARAKIICDYHSRTLELSFA
jgi:hypothetical protein